MSEEIQEIRDPLELSTRLRRVSDHLDAELLRRFEVARIKLNPRSFQLLFALSENGPLSTQQIATKIHQPLGTVTRITKLLLQQKLVLPRPDPANDRARTLLITPRGEDVLMRARPIWQSLTTAIRAALHNVDLLEALQSIVTRISEEDSPKDT